MEMLSTQNLKKLKTIKKHRNCKHQIMKQSNGREGFPLDHFAVLKTA